MDWKSLSRRPQNRMIKNFKEQVEGFAQRGNSGIVEIKNYKGGVYVVGTEVYRAMECIISFSLMKKLSEFQTILL